ncbi:MAG: type 1 glutamine amidotransferase domain-containing protein [Desulfuromonadaceae bacterium]|jgi:protease I|nr:type 1 glutamine amidotransferase [Desulfuromonas sp.]MDY0184285.1 type 1 glutamine amidotransferase domain-containing protein [Desulfuromonadaceae bacterium]
MELQNKKIAILAENAYEDMELWYPLLRFREAGAEVVVVGPQPGIFESKHGYPVRAEVAADEVSASDFDAFIIPGGYAPDLMRGSEAMISLIRVANQQGKIIAAICHAGWVLASADVLRGKKVTGYHTIKDDLINAGGNYVDREVVRDGNIITSRMPSDLPAFCRTIIAALKE